MIEKNQNVYSKDNPFKSAIKERFLLNRPGSKKSTFHIVLDLGGSGFTYRVGDSIAVIPENDPSLVEKTLHAMHARGDELVIDKHTGKPLSLYEFFRTKANITEVSKKLVQEICHRQPNSTKKILLEAILAEGARDQWKLYQMNHELWDTLQENSDVVFTPDEIASFLMPLLPRFYSISSAQSEVGEEVHLTVALLNYCTNGHLRRGVCTHYLCDLAPLHEPVIPIYPHPHHGFTLPEDDEAGIIMIGPGTGVAPFRAFMQERIKKGAQGKNWLFFGEWNRNYDFFYQEYWESLVARNQLRQDLAFSRDQDHKVYVQHRLLEQAPEVYKWMEQGAFIFVCGDAHRMAKDVDAALHKIIEEEGNMSTEAAKAYMKAMRTQKRYLRDVY